MWEKMQGAVSLVTYGNYSVPSNLIIMKELKNYFNLEN